MLTAVAVIFLKKIIQADEGWYPGPRVSFTPEISGNKKKLVYVFMICFKNSIYKPMSFA